MYIRIVNIKFASEIEADAMHAYAEHELINKLEGILSVETVRISKLHSIVINKFDSQESAEQSKALIINKYLINIFSKINIEDQPQTLEKPQQSFSFDTDTSFQTEQVATKNKYKLPDINI